MANVCFWHLADMTTMFGDVRFWGQTSQFDGAMSANDPKRTSGRSPHWTEGFLAWYCSMS